MKKTLMQKLSIAMLTAVSLLIGGGDVDAALEDSLIDLGLAVGACDLARRLSSPLPKVPPPENYNDWSFAAFCLEMANPEMLGNADLWDGTEGQYSETQWRVAHGASLDAGIVSIKGNYQPYFKKIRYKTANSERGIGVCKLEMRVYKKDPNATKLKPLLAVHGGSFKYRGFAYFGLETIISHFTERGFAVFVPFYRLAGEFDGNTECNGVTHVEIKQDVVDAFKWVQANKAAYGTTGKMSVVGHSAGGFLAQYIVTQHFSEIERALLYYPPTDFTDFINNIESQGSDAGISALESFIGLPIDEIDPQSEAVKSNNLTEKVASHPAGYPKTKILHGIADELVPSRQSVRLCNALNGNVESGNAVNDGGSVESGVYEKTYRCNEYGSSLHLFAQANHIFDICVLEEEASTCFSGNAQSRNAVRQAVKLSYDWLTGYAELFWLVPSLEMLMY